MPLDLPALTRDALRHAGIDPGLIGELDPHAAIELTFRTIPVIRIDTWEDELVMLECSLDDLQPGASPGSALTLLDSIREEAQWSYNGCVSLVDVDARPHLQVLVARSHLADPPLFAEAIEGFYTRVEKICSALKAGS
jgi:hypothetical protein